MLHTEGTREAFKAFYHRWVHFSLHEALIHCCFKHICSVALNFLIIYLKLPQLTPEFNVHATGDFKVFVTKNWAVLCDKLARWQHSGCTFHDVGHLRSCAARYLHIVVDPKTHAEHCFYHLCSLKTKTDSTSCVTRSILQVRASSIQYDRSEQATVKASRLINWLLIRFIIYYEKVTLLNIVLAAISTPKSQCLLPAHWLFMGCVQVSVHWVVYVQSVQFTLIHRFPK